MDVMRRVWTKTSPFDFDGEFYRFEQNLSEVRTYQKPHVPIYFGGASDVAKEVGAKRADVYALWGEPLESIKEQIIDIRARAAKYNRDIRFSVSVRPILGDTEGEAWERAEGILDRVKSSVGDTIGPGKPARLQSEGARRLLDFAAKGDIHDKRLWMPIAATTGAAGSTTCLVGTAEQVAESLIAYHRVGASAFIIRGFDPLQDAIDWGKDLIPIVRESASALSVT
jgi:alkanesulfonate monooxygenase